MIKLSENKDALCGLPLTISSLVTLDKLIETYNDDKLSGVGPAYVKFDYIAMDDTVQIDRSIMVEALKAQRQKLVNYLEKLGIEVDE